MTVSANGVEFAKLSDSLSESFATIPASGPAIPKLEAKYTGGEVRVAQAGEDGLLYFTLGFEAPGQTSADYYSLAVLQAVVGGAGKGMVSRLNSGGVGSSSVLKSECQAFVYSDASLFTITGCAKPSEGSGLSDFLVQQSISMTEV